MSDKATVDNNETAAVGANGAEASPVAPLPPQRKGQLRQRPGKRVILIAVGVIVLLAVAGFAWQWWQQRATDQTDTQQTSEGDAELPPQYGGQFDVSAQAVEKINTGDVDGGLALYDAAIEQAGDDEKRIGLLMEASEVVRVATAEGRIQDRQYLQRSLDYALRAEDLAHTMQSASQVWIVYRDMGDAAKAAEYEQLMMERDTSPPLEDQ